MTAPLRWLWRIIVAARRTITARHPRTARAAYEPGPGDRLIRWGTAAVVLAVAAFAAVVSYTHIYDLGRAHGQAGAAARLLPLSVDGLILAAGLVLLHAARAGHGAPVLARLMLWLGIAATVGANVAFGIRYGPLGAVISAWPAVAFIGSAEMALGMIRRTRSAPEPDTAVPAGGNGHDAALALFGPELAAGDVPSIRRIRAVLQCGQPRATEVQGRMTALLAARDGGSPDRSPNP